MVLICRICLAVIADSSNSFKLDTVDPATGFMPYWDKLTTCVPEMALDVVVDAVLCKLCTGNLETAYEFKVKCLQTETQLRTLLENSDGTQIDFNELLQRQIPKTVIVVQKPMKQYRPAHRKRRRFQFSMLKEGVKKEPKRNTNGLDVQLSPDTKPATDEAVQEVPKVEPTSKTTTGTDKLEPQPEPKLEPKPEPDLVPQPSRRTPAEKSDYVKCTTCNQRFPSSIHLKRHKARAHQNRVAIKCPLCDRVYRSSSYLARHVEMQHEMRCSICGEECGTRENYRAHMIAHAKDDVEGGERKKAIMLHKRPSLPVSAKKIMKNWLLVHYKHPYPTEKEKAELVEQTQLTQLQVENWFVNARRRILLPLLNDKNGTINADDDDNDT